MGHHHEQHYACKERELLVIQRHIVSFLLVFSVATVALIVMMASLQTRESSCQTRAQVGIYTLYANVDGDDNGNSLAGTIIGVLNQSGVHAEAFDEESACKTRQIDVFDTAEKTLAESGFRLVRQICGNDVVWQLRYLDQSLCHSMRKISMGALPNVDYEKVSYHVKAVLANDIYSFLYQVNVETNDRKRIATFPQLQSLFPGFNAQVASPVMLVSKSFEETTGLSADLYYMSRPIDIQVKTEKMTVAGTDSSFWRVSISSSNIYAERKLREAYNVILGELINRHVLCDPVSCGNSLNNDFLQ